MDNYKKFKKELESINGFEADYKKHFDITSKPDCDKHNIGFNKDSRFSCITIPVSIDSYHGYYGSSDTYQTMKLSDKEMFKEHFIKTLNTHFDRLITETIKSIKRELSLNKEKAIKDLEITLEEIKKLK